MKRNSDGIRKVLRRILKNEAVTIVVSNNAGGSHKTTAAVNLAYSLSLMKKKVLVVDFGVSPNATYYLNLDVEKQSKTMFGCLCDLKSNKMKDVTNYIHNTKYNVDIFAATNFSSTNIETALITGYISSRSIIQVFDEIKKTYKYDYIIIDMYNLFKFSHEIYNLTDFLIVSTVLSEHSTRMIPSIVENVESDYERRNGRGMQLLGILRSGIDRRETVANRGPEERLRRVNRNFETVIPVDVNVVRSTEFNKRMPVYVYKSKSRAALAYLDLVKEVTMRIRIAKLKNRFDLLIRKKQRRLLKEVVY